MLRTRRQAGKAEGKKRSRAMVPAARIAGRVAGEPAVRKAIGGRTGLHPWMGMKPFTTGRTLKVTG